MTPSIPIPKHRFYVPDAGGPEVQLTPAQAHQVHAVLRLRPGAHVRVFDGVTARDAVVQLTHLTPREARGGVVEWLPQPPEPAVRVVAYPALLQRDKSEYVLQKLVEVGVWAVAPVLSERSLVRDPPDDRRRARWQAILQEAAEQSGRGRVPTLEPTVPFPQAVASAATAGPVLLAYEAEHQVTLRTALAPFHAATASLLSLFVGPEGGYTDAEVAAARAAGAQVITLGPRTLRADTATPLAVALVLYELENKGALGGDAPSIVSPPALGGGG